MGRGDWLQSIGSQRVGHDRSDLTHSMQVALWERIQIQFKRHGFSPWVGKILWRKNWQPTTVLFYWKIQWTEEFRGLQSMESQKELIKT